ncbi:glutaredoxin 2 [Pectobacterium cacticida]
MMKLFIYEHCPFCVRARMIFGIKNIPFETVVIPEGDAETPISMVGRKVFPILQKEDGSYMAESMDIVHYVDAQAQPQILSGDREDERLMDWIKNITSDVYHLAIPRFTRADFAEIATPASRQAYIEREEKAFGKMSDLLDDTPNLLLKVNPQLQALESLLGKFNSPSINDFYLFPLLRCLTIVKGVEFGPVVEDYLSTMANISSVDLLFDKAC